MAPTGFVADGAETPWHAMPAEAVAERLSADVRSGLTEAEAARRRRHYGPNAIEQHNRRGVVSMIAGQLSDVMIIVLLVAAVIAGIVGDIEDSVVIIVIVVLNAVIGTVQEYRAERALEALQGMAAPSARILRDGNQRITAATDVVPGDVVLVTEGDIVPADMRLVEAVALRADESMLTGESVPVEKDATETAARDAAVGDRANMGFKGAIVTHGRGVGIVVATGVASELGRIAGMLGSVERAPTPLQRRLARFGWWLSLVVLVLCAIVFLFGLWRGEPPLLMFMTAVSLAVAAVPEALPAVVTVALALGARNMMRHNALVRALPAVETLGSVTTICSDKTGTLTQNRMTVDRAVSGGEVLDLDASPTDDARVAALLTGMALCNDVAFKDEDAIGDPTEVALSACAASAGLLRTELEETLPRLSEIAFDSGRKRMTTLHHDQEGFLAFTKGAPEAVVPLCTSALDQAGAARELDRSMILAEAEGLAREGLRVMAFAERRWRDTTAPESGLPSALEEDMTFVALVGLLDPPRPEARAAVADCSEAGIRPVMITGDHPETAQQIGRRLGFIEDGDQVITGPELEALDDQALAERITTVRVFARADPAQKIRIVEALQERGEIVAMTGDGVNDAPALKRADIGVAMGYGGTDVAREAASLVLLDDNFATIVGAVRAGRRIYDNVRKFIKYTMTSNSGEIWTIFLAPFFGLPIPLLPIHILWINLVTDGLPGLALAVEPEEKDVMKRPPRPPGESVFAHGMWQHIMWCGLAMGLTCLATQAWAMSTGREESWQTMVFTVLTLSQLGHVLAIRTELTPLVSSRFFANGAMLAAVGLTFALQLLVIYAPPLNPIFKTVPLSAADLAICIAISGVVATLVELEKWYRRSKLAGEIVR
jgi:Ca2+-transporting ATPase